MAVNGRQRIFFPRKTKSALCDAVLSLLKAFGSSRVVMLLASASMILAAPTPLAAQEISPQILATVAKHYPIDRILGPFDLDHADCEWKSFPGFVMADFDGDGRHDFAVLLRVGAAKQKNEESEDRRQLLRLVVFMADAKGGFKPLELFETDTSVPSIMGIGIHYPLPTKDRDTGKIVELKHHGFDVFMCGKSASLYFWKNGKFHDIVISE